jgi:hypothetical protein
MSFGGGGGGGGTITNHDHSDLLGEGGSLDNDTLINQEGLWGLALTM